MVRNAAFGCLGGALIVLIVLGLAAYFLVWRPAQAFLQNFGALTAPFTSQPNTSAPNTTTPLPTPRAEVQLTSAQVQQFVRVRRSVRQAVGQDFAQLQNSYQDFTTGQAPSTLQVLGVLRDASGFIGRARSAQQAALARENLSAAQYAEVRREVNSALGVPELDLAAAAQALRSGQLPDLGRVVVPPSERNRRLIEPFLNELRATAALGLIGL